MLLHFLYAITIDLDYEKSCPEIYKLKGKYTDFSKVGSIVEERKKERKKAAAYTKLSRELIFEKYCSEIHKLKAEDAEIETHVTQERDLGHFASRKVLSRALLAVHRAFLIL